MNEGHFGSCTGTGAPCACEAMRYGIFTAITALVARAQVFVGNAFFSLALKADGGHLASDSLGYAVSALVALMVWRGAKAYRWRFGGCLLSATILGYVAIHVAEEAVERLYVPAPATGWQAFVMSAIGLVVGYLCWRFLESVGEHEHSSTHRAVNAHLLGDMAMSAVAVVASFVAWLTGPSAVDPALSLIASCVLVCLAVRTAIDGWRDEGHHAHKHHHSHPH